jgi:hypothetical protein
MSILNNNINSFLASSPAGGGGGGVSGSGTGNFLPKWASTTSLTNSQLFDNGTSVGVGTATPTSGFLFDVNTSGIFRTFLQVGTTTVNTTIHTGKIITDGFIETSLGINISGVTGNPFNKTGLYASGNSVQYFAGNNVIGLFGLNSDNGQFFGSTGNFNPATTVGNTGTLNSLRVKSGVSPALNTNNNTVQNQIIIDPVINQINGAGTGSGALRGIYYNPTVTNLGGSSHTAWQNTSGDIIFGNLSDGSNLTTQATLVDETGKLIRQSSKNIFNLYQTGATAVGIEIDFAAGDYMFGDDNNSRAALKITTSNFIGKYNGVNQGIFLDYGNFSYTFGQFEDGAILDFFHLVDGTDGSEIAYFQKGVTRVGYEFDFGSPATFKFGDFNGVIGTSSIEIDASNDTMLFKMNQTQGSTEFRANQLIFTGVNLITNSSTGNSGNFLVVTVEGNVYHIPLDNP